MELCLQWLDGTGARRRKSPEGCASARLLVPEERSSDRKTAVERREAMRFRSFIVSQAMPEAKQHKVRLAALHAPRFQGQN